MRLNTICISIAMLMSLAGCNESNTDSTSAQPSNTNTTENGNSAGSSSGTNTTNTSPVANAGVTQNVVTNTLVILDGSASSDANGDQLTYSWSILSQPTNSQAKLDNVSTAKPKFTADVAGNYVVQLVVSDGKSNSQPVTTTVTATTVNAAPVADAGTAQSVVTATVVTLDGSKSKDANGDALSYIWALAEKPAGSTASLTNANSQNPTFTADLAGNYVAQLIVNDGKVDSVPSKITISAAKANAAPVANAGSNQSANTGAKVILDGSTSTDANGDTLTFKWSFKSKPFFSSATLTGSGAKPSFTPDKEGDYVLSLIVNDGNVDSAPTTITVTAVLAANPIPTNAGLIVKASNFYVFNEATMQTSLSSSSSTCSSIYAMDLRPDGVLVGVGSGSTGVVEIDPYQPTCIKKGNVPEALLGFAIAPDGKYWGTSWMGPYINGKFVTYLYQMNQDGTVIRKITLPDNTHIAGIDFASDGKLYAYTGLTDHKLITINTQTGSTTTVATLQEALDGYDIDIDASGTIRIATDRESTLFKFNLGGSKISATPIPNACSSCGFKPIAYR